MRIFSALVVYAGLICASEQAIMATPITVGPKEDFAGIFPVPMVVNLQDTHDFTLTLPVFGTIGFLYKSMDQIVVNTPTPLYYKSYTTYEVSNFDPQSSNLVLTDIIAVTVDRPSGLVTGFDPQTPEAAPVTPISFVGNSGILYTSDVNFTTTLGSLQAMLPGFDVSSFTGDPGRIVYVSQATVPASDGIIPEPASIELLVIGGLSAITCRVWSRHKMLVRSENSI